MGRARSTSRRAEQLRRAKRAQRRRERARGLVQVQLTLPRDVARRLAVAARHAAFPARLDGLLREEVIRLADYPALSQIAWNLAVELVPAREAFGLYERNWRWVDSGRLTDRERALIERLAARFGGGLIHA